MVIKFSCENCGQKVQAPDEHGGKRGQCPFCKHSVYIPSAPSADSGEIPLAPLTDEEQRKHDEFLRESARLKADFDRMTQNETPLPEDDAQSRYPDPEQVRKRMKDM